ncbi:MAG: 30S ribosomal protein S6 [Candidatus Nealsonbacteria bacterium]|nr:30S ribosomal protein S6 [Candidatus Nealsonbacteria bacterium]
MRIYEINYIVSGSSTEEELKSISEKINGFITESSGKVEKTAEPAKKSLGFRMSGQKDIYFNSVIFSMPQENIIEFEKKVKGENNISRYNLLKRNKVISDSLRKFPRRRSKPLGPSDGLSFLESPSPKEGKKEERARPKKVELKEIDQKIEEILSE